MATPKRVIVANVRHGSASKGRDGILYAELLDAETRELLITATLDYIVNAIETRGYRVVSQGYKRNTQF